MLQIQYIRDHKDEVSDRLKRRNFKDLELIAQAISVDEKRRKKQQELDQILAEVNTASREIGNLFSQGKKEQATVLREQVAANKGKIKQLENEQKEAEQELKDILVKIPNLPHESVPAGTSAEDNLIVRKGGNIPKLDKDALSHWDLGKKYDLIDFEIGNMLTGSGFPVFKGKGAKLQRALIAYFLDEASTQGYLEVIPPLMVNNDTAFGTGQLPDKEGQMYYVTEDQLYLIPTAEVPVTNIFRDQILSEEQFPIKMTAYTPCFRREAGSYGKDVRGLNRVHQFDKVEIVQVEHPDRSYETLEKMVEYVESLIKSLDLPYRILKLSGGDMGFTSALTYDFEVYSAAQEKWLEVSSVSNFESYQTNRMQIRFKENKKTRLAHTLNGSALALPRIMAALLENNQKEDGIMIPDVLLQYLKFKKID